MDHLACWDWTMENPPLMENCAVWEEDKREVRTGLGLDGRQQRSLWLSAASEFLTLPNHRYLHQGGFHTCPFTCQQDYARNRLAPNLVEWCDVVWKKNITFWGRFGSWTMTLNLWPWSLVYVVWRRPPRRYELSAECHPSWNCIMCLLYVLVLYCLQDIYINQLQTFPEHH